MPATAAQTKAPPVKTDTTAPLQEKRGQLGSMSRVTGPGTVDEHLHFIRRWVIEGCYEGRRSDSAANDAEVIADYSRRNDQLSIAA